MFDMIRQMKALKCSKTNIFGMMVIFLLVGAGHCLAEMGGTEGSEPPSYGGYVDMEYSSVGDIGVTFKLEKAKSSVKKEYLYLMIPADLKLDETRLPGKLVKRYAAGAPAEFQGFGKSYRLEAPVFKIELSRKALKYDSGVVRLELLSEAKGVLRAWMGVVVDNKENVLRMITRVMGEGDPSMGIPNYVCHVHYVGMKPSTKKLLDYAVEKLHSQGLVFDVLDDLEQAFFYDFDRDGFMDFLLNAKGVEVDESYGVKCYEQHTWYFHGRNGKYKGQKVFSEYHACADVSYSVLKDLANGADNLRVDCQKASFGTSETTSRVYRMVSNEFVQSLDFVSARDWSGENVVSELSCNNGLYIAYSDAKRTVIPRETGQGFRTKADSRSDPKRTTLSGHLLYWV